MTLSQWNSNQAHNRGRSEVFTARINKQFVSVSENDPMRVPIKVKEGVQPGYASPTVGIGSIRAEQMAIWLFDNVFF